MPSESRKLKVLDSWGTKIFNFLRLRKEPEPSTDAVDDARRSRRVLPSSSRTRITLPSFSDASLSSDCPDVSLSSDGPAGGIPGASGAANAVSMCSRGMSMTFVMFCSMWKSMELSSGSCACASSSARFASSRYFCWLSMTSSLTRSSSRCRNFTAGTGFGWEQRQSTFAQRAQQVAVPSLPESASLLALAERSTSSSPRPLSAQGRTQCGASSGSRWSNNMYDSSSAATRSRARMSLASLLVSRHTTAL
mmetsp:Transcript_14099/g.42187  ORF Transcript_14099/g.42187 Transcript_14099/m.42187 type:complete len:250 (-) Transcript_14099:1041-1790(-)